MSRDSHMTPFHIHSFIGCGHVLGFHFATSRDHAPSLIPVQRPWDPRRVPSHERVRISHLQTGQQRWLCSLLQVPLQGEVAVLAITSLPIVGAGTQILLPAT